MDTDAEWAISGPIVIDEAGNVQPSCRRFPKPWTFILVRSIFSKLPGAGKEKDRYLMSDYDRKNTKAVDWVSGGATLLKAETLKTIGGMDERYFLYMEDVDWCRAAWNSSYKVMYCPKSTVVHAGQHQSIKIDLAMFKSVHLKWHLNSLYKYFMKYGFTGQPDSLVYKDRV